MPASPVAAAAEILSIFPFTLYFFKSSRSTMPEKVPPRACARVSRNSSLASVKRTSELAVMSSIRACPSWTARPDPYTCPVISSCSRLS